MTKLILEKAKNESEWKNLASKAVGTCFEECKKFNPGNINLRHLNFL